MSLERHTPQDPKRFNTFADIAGQIDFLYDENREKKVSQLPKEDVPVCLTKAIINEFVSIYRKENNLTQSKEDRFSQVQTIGGRLGFAVNNKMMKE